MGTTYKVILNLPSEIKKISEIDNDIKKVLDSVVASMSTYIPTSEISKINLQKHTNWIFVSEDLGKVFNCAQRISYQTYGYFDISVGRAVNSWGFGSSPQTILAPPETKKFQSDGVFLSSTPLKTKIRKKTEETMVDVSAIAKGFAVDKICSYLEKKSLFSYMVEIGGELRVGEKDEDRNWSIGIQRPERNSKNPAIHRVLLLSSMSLATSGNYQQYISNADKVYSHIINPKTGTPAKQDHIASISVLHKKCMIADALATALFAMPLPLAIQTCKKLKLDTYFIIHKQDKDFKEIYTGNFQKYTPSRSLP